MLYASVNIEFSFVGYYQGKVIHVTGRSRIAALLNTIS